MGLLSSLTVFTATYFLVFLFDRWTHGGNRERAGRSTKRKSSLNSGWGPRKIEGLDFRAKKARTARYLMVGNCGFSKGHYLKNAANDCNWLFPSTLVWDSSTSSGMAVVFFWPKQVNFARRILSCHRFSRCFILLGLISIDVHVVIILNISFEFTKRAKKVVHHSNRPLAINCGHHVCMRLKPLRMNIVLPAVMSRANPANAISRGPCPGYRDLG